MLDAANDAVRFVQERRREDLAEDRMLALSLVKSIEIIGEAASRVSAEVQAGHTAIPWSDIVGMRNRLIHAYYDIDLDRVWDTVLDDLPLLIQELEALVNEA
jgi:uncharacterized protein with HEPN domain